MVIESKRDSNRGKVLVHVCCAPCAAPSVERLQLEGHPVALYFSNSNIHPKAEFDKRLAYVQRLAEHFDVLVEEDEYDHDQWLAHVKGLENEPERGARCRKCFDFSLSRTAALAERYGYGHFTTTLTLSPHKVSRQIFKLGEKYPRFLPVDFKKQDGFLRSLELSKELELYRQDYCGCEFSRR